MKVLWAQAAEQDRASILDHIGQENPLAASQMDERFAKAAQRLARHPRVGKLGLVQGTRELIPHESYRLVYEVHGETVWILALVHTAQLWPPAEDSEGSRP